MNKTVTLRNTYTATELAEMRLPKFPTSRKNWYALAKREKWDFIEAPGKGPGGLRREFRPPPEVLALIEQHQRGDLPPPPEKPAPARQERLQGAPVHYRVSEGSPQPEGPAGIDTALLRLCLGALAYIYGESFAAEPTALQLEYAADLYNQLVRLAAAHPAGLESGLNAFTRLEMRGLADQLRLLVQMASVRPYPAR
jgi:hypothetical protein